jgi:hypothetical protein
MATFTADRAASTFGAQTHGYGSTLAAAWGKITISANPADGDIYEMCYTPSGGDGFVALGGHFSAADLDTGTETLDIDLGWAANGSSSAATKVMPWGEEMTDSGQAASTAGLGNLGVLSGDAVTNYIAGATHRPILLATPLWFAQPTKIQLEANAASATFASGDASILLYGIIV